MPFDRNEEFAILDRLWRSDQAELLFLYGRRGIGKTYLLTQWLKQTGIRALYWAAGRGSSQVQLRSFSQAVHDFEHPDCPDSDTFSYASWEEAWSKVIRLAEKERVALIIEEFLSLLETIPTIAGKLQHFWDHHFKSSNVFLCVSGSHPGVMEKKVFSYRAPLYGRASALLHLRPLPFGITCDVFPHYTAEERLAVYSLFGGIPAYWKSVDAKRSIMDNIRYQMLASSNDLISEPQMLLKGLSASRDQCMILLAAIAAGDCTSKGIASSTGLSSRQITRCSTALRDAGFIEQRRSVTAAPNNQDRRYLITDPYLRFYFGILSNAQAQLAFERQDQALAGILGQVNDKLGADTWKELCCEWLIRASGKGTLPISPETIGNAWNETVDADVAGIDRIDKTLALGICSWSNLPSSREVISTFVEHKAVSIVPSNGTWKILFLGFSRSGWTQDAFLYARELQRSTARIENFEVIGIRLLDLIKVEQDLAQWIKPVEHNEDIAF